jgi:hypothetical protein
LKAQKDAEDDSC